MVHNQLAQKYLKEFFSRIAISGGGKSVRIGGDDFACQRQRRREALGWGTAEETG